MHTPLAHGEHVASLGVATVLRAATSTAADCVVCAAAARRDSKPSIEHRSNMSRARRSADSLAIDVAASGWRIWWLVDGAGSDERRRRVAARGGEGICDTGYCTARFRVITAL